MKIASFIFCTKDNNKLHLFMLKLKVLFIIRRKYERDSYN